eukprot:3580916-Pyramimonas_sp.AAC.1
MSAEVFAGGLTSSAGGCTIASGSIGEGQQPACGCVPGSEHATPASDRSHPPYPVTLGSGPIGQALVFHRSLHCARETAPDPSVAEPPLGMEGMLGLWPMPE